MNSGTVGFFGYPVTVLFILQRYYITASSKMISFNFQQKRPESQGHSQTFIWVGSLEEKWTFFEALFIWITLWCAKRMLKLGGNFFENIH